MPTVTVHRITIEPIQVDVPERCPRKTCGADLTVGAAIVLYEYGARSWSARLPGARHEGGFEVEQDGVFLDTDVSWRDSDGGTIPTESIECRACGLVFADGSARPESTSG